MRPPLPAVATGRILVTLGVFYGRFIQHPMPEKIRVGSLLIKGSAPLSPACWFDGEEYADAWILVRNPTWKELARQVLAAGWNFLSIRGDFAAYAFGLRVDSAVRTAVTRLTAKPTAEAFNCLEIKKVAVRRFVGLVYVCLSAQRRDIRKSGFRLRSPLQRPNPKVNPRPSVAGVPPTQTR